MSLSVVAASEIQPFSTLAGLADGFISLYNGDVAGFGLSMAGLTPFIGAAADGAKIARGTTTVIGKLDDVKNLRPGEKAISWADRGSPRENWRANSGLLRKEMRTGQPIRDVTVGVGGRLINNTGFLRAERALLQDRGWAYSPTSTSWFPLTAP
jgi:hypothetical protein